MRTSIYLILSILFSLSATALVPNACVTIFDTTPPQILLIGESEVTLLVNHPYQDLGVSVSDLYPNGGEGSGVDASQVFCDGIVDTSKIGVYVLSYYALDRAGNQSKIINRTVRVVNPTIDTQRPTITLLR